jgi:hypothetical protein
MAHTHLAPHAPLLAEINGPITIPFDIKLFHTAGKLLPDQGFLWGFYNTVSGQVPITTISMITPGPYVGDPNGLLTWSGQFTIDPNVDPSIPKWGWFSVVLALRTFYDNGDFIDNQAGLEFWSTVNPTLPDPPLGEDVPCITSRGTAVTANHAQVYGANIMRTADHNFDPNATFTLINMILNGFDTPTTLQTASYSYGPDPNFPPGSGTYQVLLDPDLHMGIPGTPLAFKSSPVAGGSTNTDTFDPAVFAASPTPMGLQPGQHRLMLLWGVTTGTGFTDQYGNAIPGGEILRTLLSVIVEVGDVPPVKLFPVPNVVGMSRSDATNTINGTGFAVGMVTNENSDTVIAGNVISQNPAAAVLAPLGAIVNMVVSLGPVTPTLPVLIGPVICYKNADGTYMFCATDSALPPNQHLCIDNVPIVDEPLPPPTK